MTSEVIHIYELKKFDPLMVSSKFAICGLPIRLDTYKNCGFGCRYCFANNRKIMEFEKQLQIGNVKSVQNRLRKVFDKQDFTKTDFLNTLISKRVTWHCGGMSDPFQPVESKYHITKDIVDVCNQYNISILFSTKSDKLYDANLNPNLHTFQFSITNVENRKDIEPVVPDIEKRFRLFDELKSKGFKVGIRIQPFIPGVSDIKIFEMFKDADHFTIEGLKLVPQNKEHKEEILKLFDLEQSQFTNMGLLNLKPEIRLKMYEPIISYLEENNMSYSIADNDLHHLGNNKCCCGDALVSKSTTFNNTYLCKEYGEYRREHVDIGLDEFECSSCKCSQLFTSNRVGNCITVSDFYDERFDRKSSPFSPKFLYKSA